MQTRHFLQMMMCMIVSCLLAVSSVEAKSKIITQSRFCADFATIAIPDSSTVFTAFADEKALVRVFNNPTGFYIQLMAADEATQQRLLFNGLTVYIDPLGKEKDKYAVTFPSLSALRQKNESGLKSNMEDQAMPAPPDQNKNQMDSSNWKRPQPGGTRRPDPTKIVQQINLKGAIFDIDGDTRAVGIEWVKLTVTPDGRICYNIKLPYKLFSLKNNTLPEALGIGLLSEAAQQQGPMGSGGMSGGPGGGMGGGPGGGMGGGPGGGMGGGPGGGGMGGGPGGGGMGGGPGGGMGGSDQQSGSNSRSSEMNKTLKGWIHVTLDKVSQ
jgi:hypothetical protein